MATEKEMFQTNAQPAEDSKDFDSESFGSGGLSRFSSSNGAPQTTAASSINEKIAARENVAVSRLRPMVLFFLAGCTVTVASLVYVGARKVERQRMETEFKHSAAKMLESFWSGIEASLVTFDSFGVSVASHAKYNNLTWPFVSLPDYGTKAAKVRAVTDSILVAQLPTVTSQQRAAWDTYSVREGRRWVDENIRIMSTDPNSADIDPFEYEVTGIWGPGAEADGWEGDHRPLWQSYPTMPLFGASPFNFDMKILPDLQLALGSLTSHFAVVGNVVNDPAVLEFARPLNQHLQQFAGDTDILEPLSAMMYPIFDDAADAVSSQDTNGTMVAITVSWFLWRSWLRDILPQGTNGIVVVFENGCEQKFTYQIDGAEATFMGFQDMHDSAYDDLKYDAVLTNLQGRSTSRTQKYTGYPLADLCPYNMSLYPSKEFEDIFHGNQAAIYTSIATAIFVFTAAVFMIYDFFVERRQEKVVSTAVKSSAIVSSLFPKNVQDRLYEQEKDTEKITTQKEKLKTFMNHGLPKSKMEGSMVDRNICVDNPIADLFPSATVLFGDIAGFTAWSSQRQPTQVFALLESLYGLFDTLATKRGVFKVETIGDCYMAVAGLPDPRPDHAIVCAKFARDCCVHMVALLSKLAVTLGPDTEDLAMRFGLNSGPVTAGVLRGQKSRFQLFGDTVNTASRMESTSMRNRIQASESTADEIRRHQKGHWLRKRDGVVEIKGKGPMETFWVEPTDTATTSRSLISSSCSKPLNSNIRDPAQLSLVPQKQEENREERLVAWNIDILAQLLGAVVARHKGIKDTASHSTIDYLHAVNTSLLGPMAIDEIKEMIRLPNFDPSLPKSIPDANELEPEVMSQLQEFVQEIAACYKRASNPFHGFEHASHVCMSVSKLMSRIVAADLVHEKAAQGESLEYLKHQQTFGIASDPLALFACAFSALIHDADHPGVPNTQLVTEGAALASKYGNRSVAEQHSFDVSWGILMSSRYEALRRSICPTAHELKRFRELVVNITLATDVMDEELRKLRNERWQRAFNAKGSSEGSCCDDMNRKATIVLEHLIQASDVAHTMQHWHVYRKWNERLFEEMMQAYESGRMEADPRSFWYRGELGFFDHYIIPLARKLSECGVFGVSSDEYLSYAMKNRSEWALKGESIVEEMVKNRATSVVVSTKN